jgi:hypothetical protein
MIEIYILLVALFFSVFFGAAYRFNHVSDRVKTSDIKFLM